jgi:hypothetical protein
MKILKTWESKKKNDALGIPFFSRLSKIGNKVMSAITVLAWITRVAVLCMAVMGGWHLMKETDVRVVKNTYVPETVLKDKEGK